MEKAPGTSTWLTRLEPHPAAVHWAYALTRQMRIGLKLDSMITPNCGRRVGPPQAGFPQNSRYAQYTWLAGFTA